jgi:hypothetical protein
MKINIGIMVARTTPGLQICVWNLVSISVSSSCIIFFLVDGIVHSFSLILILELISFNGGRVTRIPRNEMDLPLQSHH